MFLIGLVVVLVVIAAYAVTIYNALQNLTTQIEASIQEIGNQLKRQANLIPNLQSTVKGYLKHEKELFKLLTDARKQATAAVESGNAADIEQAIDSLRTVIPQIQVAVEDNPEIKSDATITQFMSELTDTADKLTYARRSVIDLTQSYNVKLVTFPSNLIAQAFGFQKKAGLSTPESGAHLTVSDAETKDVTVEL